MKSLALPVAAGAVLALAALVAVTLLRPIAPATRAETAHQVAADLRCPDCQGLSVADSPSQSAAQIRGEIAQLLSQGLTAQAIRDRFVARYGEWILLAPPSPLAWALPVAVAILAVAALAGRLWRGRAPSGGQPASGGSESPVADTDLARVRDEAEALDA